MNYVQFFADCAIRVIYGGNVSVTQHIVQVRYEILEIHDISLNKPQKKVLKFRKRICKHYRIAVIWGCARGIYKNSIDIYHRGTMTMA